MSLIIGFSDILYEDLTEFHYKREPVLFINCNLHKGKRDHNPQLFINKGRTKIHKSASFVDMKPSDYHRKITKHIQKVTFADKNAYATIQLWEEDIDKLNEGTSYNFNNITTSEYYVDRYFTFSAQSTATEIPDIGPVMKISEGTDSQVQASSKYDDVYVAGIAQFNPVEKCLYKNCKGKQVPHLPMQACHLFQFVK